MDVTQLSGFVAPLSRDGCKARIHRLIERIPDNLDGVLLARPEHVYYFCGHMNSPNTIAHRSPAYLLIRRGGETVLVLDGKAKASPYHSADRVVAGDWGAIDSAHTCYRAAAAAATQVLQANGVRHAGIETASMPLAVVQELDNTTDVEQVIAEMRQVKCSDELVVIRAAIRVGEAFLAAARECLEPGIREIDLYARCLDAATRAAQRPFVMMCDFASGPLLRRGGAPTDRVIEQGDNVLLDIFPYVCGYRCDIANTLTAGGKPTDDQLYALEAAQAGMTACEDLAKPGVTAGELFEAQDEAIRDFNPDWSLDHHAGHALGLEHPEAPDFVLGNPTKLVEGEVITFEPGVYAPTFQGGRIEHNYLVTNSGLECLSNHRIGLV